MGEAEAILKKTERFAPEFTAALTTLSNNETMEKVSQALSAQMLFGGNDVVDVLSQAFRGIPIMEKFMKDRGVEASKPRNGRRSVKTTGTPSQPTS